MSSTSALNSLLSSASTTSTSSSLNLGDILAAATGTSTPGIDVNAAVTAALYAARAPERIWQTQQTTLASQTTALTAIQTATAAIATDLQSLNSVVGPLSARSVSSTSSAVSATASSGTVSGNHTVTVTNLATTASWYSDAQTSASSTLAAGTFTITQGSTTTSIDTGSGVDALSALASTINGKGLGITASVVTDAAGARLSLVATNSGSASDFSVTSSSGIAFNRAGTGLNASLTVDGVPISSASNTVKGALAGVTLNLLAPTVTGTPANLSVQSDATQVATALSQFVTDYNTAIGLVNAQFTYSGSTSSQGVLGSDPTLRSLQNAMYSALSYTSSGTSTISSLSALGISTNTDGTLSLDTTTLGDALSSSPDDVQKFLQGDSLNGFAASFNNALSGFTTPGTGAFTVELNSMKSTNTSLQNQIDDFESGYIANQQTILTAMYSQAEIALQQLPTQMKQLQAQLGNNNNS